MSLGFAELNGKAYGIIVRMADDQQTRLLNRKDYITLDEKEPPADGNAIKEWLVQFLRDKAKSNGEQRRGGLSRV